MTKKRLFCILPPINLRQFLSTACSQDLYIAKDAIDT